MSDIERTVAALNEFATEQGVPASLSLFGDSETHVIMTYEQGATTDREKAMKVSGFISVAESEGVHPISVDYVRPYSLGEDEMVMAVLGRKIKVGAYSVLNEHAIVVEVFDSYDEGVFSSLVEELASVRLPLSAVLVFKGNKSVALLNAGGIREEMDFQNSKRSRESVGIPETKEGISSSIDDFLDSL